MVEFVRNGRDPFPSSGSNNVTPTKISNRNSSLSSGNSNNNVAAAQTNLEARMVQHNRARHKLKARLNRCSSNSRRPNNHRKDSLVNPSSPHRSSSELHTLGRSVVSSSRLPSSFRNRALLHQQHLRLHHSRDMVTRYLRQQLLLASSSSLVVSSRRQCATTSTCSRLGICRRHSCRRLARYPRHEWAMRALSSAVS